MHQLELLPLGSGTLIAFSRPLATHSLRPIEGCAQTVTAGTSKPKPCSCSKMCRTYRATIINDCLDSRSPRASGANLKITPGRAFGAYDSKVTFKVELQFIDLFLKHLRSQRCMHLRIEPLKHLRGFQGHRG